MSGEFSSSFDKIERFYPPPPPLRGTPPVSGVESVTIETPRQPIVPLRQGAKRVFRRMTECHSVPSKGSTTKCDAGPKGAKRRRGWIKSS